MLIAQPFVSRTHLVVTALVEAARVACCALMLVSIEASNPTVEIASIVRRTEHLYNIQ
jgi:hypothetical protein